MNIKFLQSELRFLKLAVQGEVNDLEDNQPLSQDGEKELSMLKALWNKLNSI